MHITIIFRVVIAIFFAIAAILELKNKKFRAILYGNLSLVFVFLSLGIFLEWIWLSYASMITYSIFFILLPVFIIKSNKLNFHRALFIGNLFLFLILFQLRLFSLINNLQWTWLLFLIVGAVITLVIQTPLLLISEAVLWKSKRNKNNEEYLLISCILPSSPAVT